MGAYAMPGNTSFRTSKEIKKVRTKPGRIDRCAALLRENDMTIDKENNRIILVKKDD